MIPHDVHLHIGSLLFEGVDQIDLTGPFEVLSRIPNATYRIYGKTAAPVRDLRGLRLTPDATLADAPPLDVLHVPGGYGQEALMEDAEVLGWMRQQASGACRIFSVCTGALICGAAGLIKGRRATTHWSAFHLLPYFGAIPVNERVVVDGAWVFAAGVTAGIDGALRLAAELRGDEAAQAIQLHMAYAPEPPFDSGTPESAPTAILEEVRLSVRAITAQREQTARRIAAKLGIAVPAAVAGQNLIDDDVKVLERIYDRFNARDMDGVLTVLTDDVVWANGMDGGHVHGREAVRAYWTRQWTMVSPNVEPVGFHRTADGAIVAEVRQTIRDLEGKPLQGQTHGLKDKMVGHVFRLRNGKVARFDIQDAA